MSFGIYKQGQGYWVRVMTAAFVGVIIIAAAAWGWGQAGTIRLPARSWSFSLSNVDGAVEPGESVDLLYYDTTSENPEELVVLGSATVDTFSSKGTTANLVVSTFSDEQTRDRAGDSVHIRAGESESPKFDAFVRTPSATPIFPVEYLQSGIAGGIMLIGVILLYIFVGVKKQTVEFLIATDGEMKKVNWTTYREVKGSTIVVIVATFLIAGFLFLVDLGFSNFFRWIDVLQ
ncbi:MAG: preprotein translocase subunit SecE [Phycisphaerales bacterium]